MARPRASIATKATTLAKQNERAQDVAERQKSATSASMLQTTTQAQEKQTKAEGIPAALLKEQVDKAAQQVSKARELSNKSKEELQSQLRSADARGASQAEALSAAHAEANTQSALAKAEAQAKAEMENTLRMEAAELQGELRMAERQIESAAQVHQGLVRTYKADLEARLGW